MKNPRTMQEYCLFVCLFGWLVGWLVGRSVGWLVGWLLLLLLLLQPQLPTGRNRGNQRIPKGGENSLLAPIGP